MNFFLKGITYSYNRNIGWQDRTIRTIVGVLTTILLKSLKIQLTLLKKSLIIKN